jgi:hypothetical protein
MIVWSNRLATYTKRAALCFAFACNMWTNAGAADPNGVKPTLCPSAEITIFSCQTTKQEIISICLIYGSKLTVLSMHKAGPAHSDRVTGAEEAIIGNSAHGENVVLQLKTASRTSRLFAALDPYDMEPAVFEIGTGPESRKVCVFDTQMLGTGVIKRNGITRDVELSDLDTAGLAAHLENVPIWPGSQ